MHFRFSFMFYFYVTLCGIIIFQLVLPFITVWASRWLGRDLKRTAIPPNYPEKDIACIITAYKNASIAVPLMASLIRQNYSRFHIYLVADECPDADDVKMQDEKISILYPPDPLRLKVKSIIYATAHFVREHEYIAIFDADNLAHPDFLKVINAYAAAGQNSIQGQRTAKNTDNAYAAADSLGEAYKNYIERYAPWLLGSSAVISGSGMAVSAPLYMAYLNSPAIQKGQHLGKKMLQEDKILQNFLLLNGERIAFAKNAICFDEKVQSAAAVQTQRSRWLFSYFQNLPNTLKILAKGIIAFDWNRILFGLVTLSLPMFIQVGIAVVLMLLGWWLYPLMGWAIAIALGVFAGTILWVLSLSGAPRAVYRAVVVLPQFIWRQAKALAGMRNPDKNFQPTQHSKVVTLDDLLDKD